MGLIAFIICSDMLDGRLARYLKLASKFGYVLDGLSDRSVHVAAYLLLARTGLASDLLLWVLMFRELCLYAARVAEPNWLALQTRLDRLSTRFYSAAVHGLLLLEVARTAIAPEALTGWAYPVAVNLLLGAVAGASYARIVPQLYRAWRRSLP